MQVDGTHRVGKLEIHRQAQKAKLEPLPSPNRKGLHITYSPRPRGPRGTSVATRPLSHLPDHQSPRKREHHSRHALRAPWPTAGWRACGGSPQPDGERRDRPTLQAVKVGRLGGRACWPQPPSALQPQARKPSGLTASPARPSSTKATKKEHRGLSSEDTFLDLGICSASTQGHRLNPLEQLAAHTEQGGQGEHPSTLVLIRVALKHIPGCLPTSRRHRIPAGHRSNQLGNVSVGSLPVPLCAS